MKAMILAAGQGTRLRPLTEHIPKCMVRVGGKPVLEHTIEWLRQYGVTDLIINLYHLPDVVMNHFGDGSRWGVNITYSVEKEVLGTAGGVRNVEWFFDEPAPRPPHTGGSVAHMRQLKRLATAGRVAEGRIETKGAGLAKALGLDTRLKALLDRRSRLKLTRMGSVAPQNWGAGGAYPFLVWYGDNLSTCDLTRLYAFHQAKGGVATIALHYRADPTASGIVGLDENDRITRFLEKPQPAQVFSHWVSAGIFVLEPQVLEAIPAEGAPDFGRDVFPALLAQGAALYGYRMSPDEGLWWIDTPEDLQRVQEDGRWKTEGGRRRTEDGGRKTEGGGRRAEGGRRKAEGG